MITKLPMIDVTTSNYTICAAQSIEAAKNALALAYHAQAKGKYDLAAQLYADAVESYAIASKKLAEHATFMTAMGTPTPV
jgi:hypothetical protein